MITLRRVVQACVIVVLAVLGAYIFIYNSAYRHNGPPTDHFDGSCFSNYERDDHTFTDMVKWMWEMETVEWPEWIEDSLYAPPPQRIASDSLRVTYVNHATMLIQTDSLNILTDPMWSLRASPTNWMGPKRIRAPGVRMDDLPGIDYLLISHDHFDHLDLPSIEKIAARDHPVILVGLGNQAFLNAQGIQNVVEMDWWQTYRSANGTVITFVPARHNSGRWPFMDNRTLWGGFVIKRPAGEQIYYAGDTGYGQFLDSIANRFDRIRLAILPLGNYEKRWFMKSQHMNPEDAVRAHLLLRARQSVGHHYATFAEHPEQTVDAHEKDLSAALTNYGVPPSQFRVLEFGEGRAVPDF